MRSKIPALIFLLTLVSLIELYTYNGISTYFNTLTQNTLYYSIYFGVMALSFFSVISMVNNMDKGIPGLIKKPAHNLLGGMALTLLLTKLSFITVMFAEDLFRAGLYGYQKAFALFEGLDRETVVANRNVLVAQIGLGLSSIPLVSFVHGITRGKYKFTVKNVPLFFNDLPKAFEGYKILQFSDMHAGSFDSLDQVEKGFDLMNKQGADLILFTGDMVNNHANEVLPFLPLLEKLKARDGKYSILGNHDYGDYIHWDSKESKIQNLYQLIHHQEKAGFKMLLNEHVRISKGSDELVLVGVENWGKPPFPQHGDLIKSLEGIDENAFTILMSHDPSHWELEVIQQKKKIHLTMSGHTHGMQFGFDIPGLKWSPVKYKYPRWSGLYEELGRYLYVNNGFGFLGFPGRVGIYPEITVFELKAKNA